MLQLSSPLLGECFQLMFSGHFRGGIIDEQGSWCRCAKNSRPLSGTTLSPGTKSPHHSTSHTPPWAQLHGLQMDRSIHLKYLNLEILGLGPSASDCCLDMKDEEWIPLILIYTRHNMFIDLACFIFNILFLFFSFFLLLQLSRVNWRHSSPVWGLDPGYPADQRNWGW